MSSRIRSAVMAIAVGAASCAKPGDDAGKSLLGWKETGSASTTDLVLDVDSSARVAKET
jgi:hypothetical protein